jgi:hypothetical protein
MLQTCPRSKRVAPRTRGGNHLQKWSRASSPVAAARRVRGWIRGGSSVDDGHRRRALGGGRSTGRLRGSSHRLSRWCSNHPNYVGIGRGRSGDGCRNGRCSARGESRSESRGESRGECWHGCGSSGGGCRHGGRSSSSSGLAVGGDGVRRRGGGGGGARGRRSQRRRLRRTSLAGHPDVVGTGTSVHLVWAARRRCGCGARGRRQVGHGAAGVSELQVHPSGVRGVAEMCPRRFRLAAASGWCGAPPTACRPCPCAECRGQSARPSRAAGRAPPTARRPRCGAASSPWAWQACARPAAAATSTLCAQRPTRAPGAGAPRPRCAPRRTAARARCRPAGPRSAPCHRHAPAPRPRSHLNRGGWVGGWVGYGAVCVCVGGGEGRGGGGEGW